MQNLPMWEMMMWVNKQSDLFTAYMVQNKGSLHVPTVHVKSAAS